MSYKHQRWFSKYSAATTVDDLDRPFSSLSDAGFSAPFSNTFSTAYTSDPLHDVDQDGKRQLLPTAPLADEWPKEPMSLSVSRGQREHRLKMIWDCLIVVLPALLLAKAALVITAWRADRVHRGLDIDQTSQLTLTLIRINEQMVTVFTVIFVGIISTTVQRYALFKAQNGVPIAELELLQGSVSPMSTVKLMVTLRSVPVTSLVLGLIWSFYYLGSQANTFEYRFEQSLPFRTMNAILPPNRDSGWGSIFMPAESDPPEWIVNFANAIATTAEGHYRFLSQPGADNSGFPLVPNLGALLDAQIDTPEAHIAYKPGIDGWVDVSKQSQTLELNAYSSMMGWPYLILNDAVLNKSQLVAFESTQHFIGDLTFTPKYLCVDCSVPTIQPDDAFPQSIFDNQTLSFRMTNDTQVTPVDKNGYHQRSFEFWLKGSPNSEPPIINTTMTICNVTRVTLDLKVKCQFTGCSAAAARWANGTDIDGAISLHTPFTDDRFASLFFDNFARFYDTGHVTGFKPAVTDYMNSFLMSPQGHDDHVQSERAIKGQLRRLLTMNFNTYLTSSQATHPAIPYDPAVFDLTGFNGALYEPQYVISWPWIIMDLISCFLLLGAAIFSAVLRTRTLAPDILGSVSSLMRDTPYSGMPNNATGLSGRQRTRLMHRSNVKVQLGDVSGQDEVVGRIALTRLDPNGGKLKVLNKHNKYY